MSGGLQFSWIIFRWHFRRWTTASEVEDSDAGEGELSDEDEGVYEVCKAR